MSDATLTIALAQDEPRRKRGFMTRLFRDKPLGAIGGLVLLFMVFCALFADVLAPYGQNQVSMLERLHAPSWQHWFGTDNLGRDVLSRCLYGARLSVIIGCSAAAIATLISVTIGKIGRAHV